MNKQQLANKIWASANKMRSKIEANEYKDYILGLIFYKFLSDNEISHLKSEQVGMTDEDLKSMVEDFSDPIQKQIIDYCRDTFGYYIEYKNLFSTWLDSSRPFSVSDLSQALSAFDRLVSDNYKHVYEGIFLTLQAGLSKLGQGASEQTKALKELIKLIKDIPTDSRQDYDVLGFVYEYLISNFAASAGKKAGEFYTPHEVAQLMSEIVAEHHKDKDRIEIYDPTSGSGSLLITIGKAVGKHMENTDRVKYFAQELKENTYNLTRMNLVMRGIQPANIVTRCADSLAQDWPIQLEGSSIGKPLYVDAVVSNPPYSQHWDPTDRELDPRFASYGLAPKTKADYAFLLHELHHLKPDGILTIVLPHGVLFRGNPEDDSEGKIRMNLIENNNIDAIIGLPAGIFFGTGIPTLIMVLKQHRDNDDVLIIDASKEYVKEKTQNKLLACNIRRIVDVVRERKTVDGFSRVVSRDEIRENGYNLNIPRYVDSSETAIKYDIYATMFGGIPNNEIDEMKDYWLHLQTLKGELFQPLNDRPYSVIKTKYIKKTIEQNHDVKFLQKRFEEAFNGFADSLHQKLIEGYIDVKESKALDEITADIFTRWGALPLIDRYAAFQALSSNWSTITDDIEILQQEGFDAVRGIEPAYKIVKKDDEDIETPAGEKGRIIPFELVQKVKFQLQLAAISEKQAMSDQKGAEADALVEEFTEDEIQTYFTDEESPKLDKAKVKKDAKDKSGQVEKETKEKLQKLVKLWDEQSKLNKQVKAEKKELIEKTKTTIMSLSQEDAEMFLHMKWIDPVCDGINKTFIDMVSILVKTVSSLADKYAESYDDIKSSLSESETQLSNLICQLSGDEFAIRGLSNLIKK